jgi:molybdenum-dependent DNA-binding transcriptional regulator ModE
LDGNPVAEGVRYYNELRKKVLIEARNRGREGLGADDVEDLRVYLSEYADAITAQYPEFARVYDRLLSKELEQ